MPPPTVSIEELEACFEDPASYPYAPESVSTIQTHISLVGLAPPYVYKVKKPVELGFLDFSTLDARRRYCQIEVELNRRLCGEIYEGVVPIVRTESGLAIDQEGDVVEYAVKMKHLSREGFLDHKLNEDTLSHDDLDRVVATLCRFYDARPSGPDIAEEGRIEHLRVNTDENFEQTREHVGPLLPRPTYEALKYYTDRFYDQHAALFNQRRADGHIIDGHGDLRLEHIHLTPEQVCIYDCIEFNERFRRLDVANDAAFLAMDLDVHNRQDLSQYILRRLAESLNDSGLLLLSDFYSCYRAYVRGKVACMRAGEPEVHAEDRDASRKEAQMLFQWALRYAVAGPRPLVVIVMGRAGTGKTTQARALGDALGWTVVSSDWVRKSKAGLPLYERPDDDTRAQLYTAEMTDAVYRTLLSKALERADANEGAILDATYSSRTERDHLRSALREAGIPYLFTELVAGNDTLKDRLGRRNGEHTVSDARREDFDMLNTRYEAPDALEDARHVRISTANGVEDATLDILRHLIRFKAEPTPLE